MTDEEARVSSYKTIEGRASAEIVEKKSRFIGNIAHAETEDDALAFLEEIRSAHRSARHNVYAYVICGGGHALSAPRIRYSDDGEPSKTAGVPTLEVLEYAGLSDVAVVVTRYFGGVLLGTGGLVRAYTQATQAAIEAAHVVVMARCVDLELVLPYSIYDRVQHMIQGEDVRVINTEFSDVVHMTLRVQDSKKDALIEKLTEFTHAQSKITPSAPFNAVW